LAHLVKDIQEFNTAKDLAGAGPAKFL